MVCALLVALWVASGWYHIRVAARYAWQANIVGGRGELWRGPGAVPGLFGPEAMRRGNTFSILHAPFAVDWGFERRLPVHAGSPPRSGTVWIVPLWAPFLLAAGATVLAWRLDTLARRRARAGFCPKCGYNRTGLAPGAVCPECGAAAIVPPSAVS